MARIRSLVPIYTSWIHTVSTLKVSFKLFDFYREYLTLQKFTKKKRKFKISMYSCYT